MTGQGCGEHDRDQCLVLTEQPAIADGVRRCVTGEVVRWRISTVGEPLREGAVERAKGEALADELKRQHGEVVLSVTAWIPVMSIERRMLSTTALWAAANFGSSASAVDCSNVRRIERMADRSIPATWRCRAENALNLRRTSGLT